MRVFNLYVKSSLSKLKKAMGHSSLAVSLTYLRGLEVSELEESDMTKVINYYCEEGVSKEIQVSYKCQKALK